MKRKIIFTILLFLIPTTAWGAFVISQGGTNIISYTIGDLIYASASTVLSKLGIGSEGKFLTVSGGLPAWGDAVDLTSDQTIAGIKTFSTNIQTTAGDCTADNEYCPKSYIETLTIQPSRSPVRAITTGALPDSTYNNGFSGQGANIVANANGALPAQDGVTLDYGDRLLVKNQTNTTQNGFYIMTAVGDVDHVWELTRTVDFDEAIGSEISNGAYTYATEGDTAATFYSLVSDDTIVIGTSNLTWMELSPQGTYYAGNGLDLNSLTFSVDVKVNDGLKIDTTELTVDYDNSSIGIMANKLAVLAGGVTNAMLAGLIDLTTKVTGVLPEAKGGTGESTYTNGQLLIGNSSGGLTKNKISEGSNVTITQGDGAITIASASGGNYTGDGVSLTTALLTIGNDAILTGERAIGVTSTNLTYTDTGANGSYKINTIQDIAPESSPTFANLNLTYNATSSGYLTVGTAPTYALFTAGNANIQNNLTTGGYATTTGGLYTSGNAHIGGALTLDTPLAVSQGGTASTTIATGNLMYGVSQNVIGALLPPSIANWVLRSTAANTFAWGALVDADIPDTITVSNYLALSTWFATTTWAGGSQNLTVGGYSSSTNLYSQGALHIGGASTFDGALSGAGWTSSQQSWWNNTSTWAGSASEFAKYYNATNTQAGFATQFASYYNATNTQAGFQTQFNTALNATTTLDLTTFNVNSASTSHTLYVGSYASSTGGLFTQGNGHYGGTLSVDNTATFNGNVTLGDAAADTITVVAATELQPSESGTNRSRRYRVYKSISSSGVGWYQIGSVDMSSFTYAGAFMRGTVTNYYFGGYSNIEFYLKILINNGTPVLSFNYWGNTDGNHNLALKETTAGSEVYEIWFYGQNYDRFMIDVYYGGGDSVNWDFTNFGTAETLDVEVDTAPNLNYYFAGNVGIGDASPASLFTVGSGDDFQISLTGAVTNVVSDTNGIAIYGKETGAGTPSIGVKGETTAVNTAGYGLYGLATGAGTLNVGVYGDASGAGTNWSGYFVGGVYIGGNTEFASGLTAANATNLKIRPNGLGSVTFFEDNQNPATYGVFIYGNTTTTGSFVNTKTTDIGWSVVTGTNAACNTTCTNACVAGMNAGATANAFLACTDATAESCLCAGSN